MNHLPENGWIGNAIALMQLIVCFKLPATHAPGKGRVGRRFSLLFFLCWVCYLHEAIGSAAYVHVCIQGFWPRLRTAQKSSFLRTADITYNLLYVV